jgi:ankyrin repeat protein
MDTALSLSLPDEMITVARRGELKKMCKWLRKGSVDAQRPDGNTLLHTAVIYRQPDLVRELTKRGAVVDILNNDGSTALMAAAQLGATTEAQILIEHDSDVNKQTPHGATALMSAAAHEKPEMLSLLLAASAAPDAQTRTGETALMSAAACGADKCVELLLEAGASTELENDEGYNALRCAELKGHPSTQLLLQRACSPPASPSEVLAPHAVLLKTSDGRRFQVPESCLSEVACSESRRTRRSLYRHTGLLAKELRR